MKYAFFIASILAIAVFGSGCASNSKSKPVAAGMWNISLALNDTLMLPFNFEWAYSDAQKPLMTILNAEERIEVDEIIFIDDSVFIRMPLFDSEFRLQQTESGKTLKGRWIKHGKNGDVTIPCSATNGRDYRFGEERNATGTPANFEGKWQVTFSPNQGDKASPAIGLFKQEGKYITGTFATETGDYRYLEGAVVNKKMLLSCFDGSHAYLFRGELVNDKLQGTFYAGKSHQEPFEGVRNEQFELRSADALTYLNPGYKEVAFSFKNLEGKTVSLSDVRYKNKPVIVQLMGSWCPNCMDEARLFSQLHKKYHGKGLEVIALAYEYSPDFEKAAAAVRRHKQRLGCDYEFLITGVTPDKAAASLPMLNHVMSFPTSIFIDKKGTVRRIHTGFYGPGTGDYYTKFVAETESLLNQLVTE